MLHRMMAAGFQQIVEADDIAFDIDIRVIDGIPGARLGRKIYYNIKVILLKQRIYQNLIPNGTFYEYMLDRAVLRSLFQKAQTVLFQCRIIIVIHIIKADDRTVGHLSEKPHYKICSDEAGRTSHQDRLSI